MGNVVVETILTVLDGTTGAHRWSRLMDADTSNISLGMDTGGDLLIALHGSLAPIAADYGSGRSTYASHVFRLRSH